MSKKKLQYSATVITLFSLTLPAMAQQKPNILFFLMDDLGYAELGCYGQKKIETPNIDRLASEGKIFSQHYSGSPVSAPSRSVLMTGLHTGHSPVRGNDEADERGNVWSHQAMLDNQNLEGQRPMPADTRTLGHALQEAGYVTACIGKWGLGYPGSVSEPNKMGFDFFFGYNCQRQAHTYYPTHLYRNNERVYLNNKVLQPSTMLDKDACPNNPESYAKYTQNDYAPDLMFEQTLKFIEDNKSRPFFVWWTTPLPHVPLQAPKKLVDYYISKFGEEAPYTGQKGYFPSRYPHATYAAMVTYIDEQVGAIIQKLKEEGVYDNTVIVFTSDNGPTFNGGTDSPWFDSAHPFSSEHGWGKASLREGGIRVPTIVKWSGNVKPGSKTDYISCFYDWMPTLCEIAGAKANGNADGVSLVNVLTKGKIPKREYLYWEFPEAGGSLAVRCGEWKLLIQNLKKKPQYMLYNLDKDPLELNNLYDNKPKIVARMLDIVRKEHVRSANSTFDMTFFDTL